MKVKLENDPVVLAKRLTSDTFRLNTRIDVAELLEVPNKFLCSILRKGGDRAQYNHFKIPKATGGYRKISSPPKNLSILQKKLAAILLAAHSPKPSSHAFLKDRSIRTNAEPHCGCRNVLNLDLKDYFPTIHIGRFIGILIAPPYRLGRQASYTIAQICFEHDGRLPQGGATSPIVSNMVTKSLDDSLQNLAASSGCKYTRYADDITFSTTRTSMPSELSRIDKDTGKVRVGGALKDAIDKASFKINYKKVRLQTSLHTQRVTGITVNEFPNLRRSYINNVDSILQGWAKYGYEKAYKHYIAKCGLDPSCLKKKPSLLKNVLAGKLTFLEMVRDSDAPICRRIRWAMSELMPTNISPPCKLEALRSMPLTGQRDGFSGWQNVNRRLRASILFIEGVNEKGDKQCASGFVVGNDCLITAGHIPAKLKEIVVHHQDSELIPSECVHINEPGKLDVAVMLFDDAPFTDIAKVYAQHRLPEVGEEVAAIGYPVIAGRNPTIVMHVGTVEAITHGYKDGVFIQTSFASGGGLSGGVLVDKGGLGIGVMVENVYLETKGHGGQEAVVAPARLYGQATPIEYALLLRRYGADFRDRWLKKKPAE